MKTLDRIPLALFTLRIGVFVVMLMWTLDKFIRPEHASAVYETFYQIGGLSSVLSYLIGGFELLILAGFIVGYKKQWTYLAVLILHGISTLSSYQQYLAPYESVNLLFFAAWPMLSACFVLYYLRDQDTLYTLGR